VEDHITADIHVQPTRFSAGERCEIAPVMSGRRDGSEPEHGVALLSRSGIDHCEECKQYRDDG
jgi:hypothetical protein